MTKTRSLARQTTLVTQLATALWQAVRQQQYALEDAAQISRQETPLYSTHCLSQRSVCFETIHLLCADRSLSEALYIRSTGWTAVSSLISPRILYVRLTFAEAVYCTYTLREKTHCREDSAVSMRTDLTEELLYVTKLECRLCSTIQD